MHCSADEKLCTKHSKKCSIMSGLNLLERIHVKWDQSHETTFKGESTSLGTVLTAPQHATDENQRSVQGVFYFLRKQHFCILHGSHCGFCVFYRKSICIYAVTVVFGPCYSKAFRGTDNLVNKYNSFEYIVWIKANQAFIGCCIVLGNKMHEQWSLGCEILCCKKLCFCKVTEQSSS